MDSSSQQTPSAIRNVGLFAHVDAGKTTTTEQMLYVTGRIRTIGNVDEGTTQTDWLDVERQRGISVRMATTVLPWRGVAINLVDTPGHIDFVGEVERTLQVIDGAVLIISAAEGVQAHTETLWHALRSRGIPTLLFLNKLDRMGVDLAAVLNQIRTELTDRIVLVQELPETEADFVGVTPRATDGLAESVAELDEIMLEQYLSGETVERSFVMERLSALTQGGEAFPVLFGAANKGLGTEELLDACLTYLPPPAANTESPFSGVVFKLDRDPAMGRVAYVRLFGGQVQNRESVRNDTQDVDAKVAQVRKMYARHHEDVGLLAAGDIGALCGLGDVRVGDVLGDPSLVPPAQRLAVPVLGVRVQPERPADLPALVQALQELSAEDPLLDFQWTQESRELQVKVMGRIQIEILEALLKERFGLPVRFDPPTVIYQETPSQSGEGFVAYTMPKPCWAVLRFAIEPGPRGSGLVYSSAVSNGQLLPAYQREVERRVPEALRQGLYGWQVTDLKVTLIYGESHNVHTHPLDFVVATPMGLMDGLSNTGTTLLEPLYTFRISVPEEAGGRVMSDLIQMRGEFEPPIVVGGRFVIEGKAPVATAMDYPIRLSSMTGGRGVITTRFGGYQPAPPDVKAVREREGVNPLDRAKYILSVRGAL